MSGYVAVLAEGSPARNKSDAEIVESALIYAGEQIDQRPLHNDSNGKVKGLKAVHSLGHGTVRIRVSGFHPLRWNSPLKRIDTVTIRLHLDCNVLQPELRHPWRRIT